MKQVQKMADRLVRAMALLHRVSGMWHSRVTPPGEIWEGPCHRDIDALLKENA